MKFVYSFIIILAFVGCRYNKNAVAPLSFEGGTAILTLLSNDSVWIVADSKRKAPTSSGKRYETVCKINYSEGIYYTFSGKIVKATDNRDGTDIFTASLIMGIAISKYKNFDSIYSYFDSTAKSKLSTACKMYFDGKPDYFKKEFLNKVLIEFTIATFISNKLMFRNRAYICEVVNGKIEIQNRGREKEKAFPFLIRSGKHKAIDSFLNKNQKFDIRPSKIESWGQYLIGLEIKRDSSAVGKPINIISFGHDNTPRWRLKNQPCN